MTEPGFGPAHPTSEQTGERRLAIQFTGSGSEYFRIWIVNLLLTIVTLSLYHPWAKVRRLRYFYGNTLVDGHALDFHGDPKKMLRGYLLVGLMAIVYGAAGKLSPTAGFVAFLIIAAIWPALLKASMQFRLANTSWRGLRFRFRGDVAGAYKALLPLFIPSLLLIGMVAMIPDQLHPPAWYLPAFGLTMLGTFLLLPLLLWKLKKYLHDHYSLGQVQTELKASVGSFYGVFLKTFGVAILSSIVLGIVIAVIAGAGIAAMFVSGGKNGNVQMVAMFVGFAVVIVMMIGAQLLPRPYFDSRMQNLLWGQTLAEKLQFKSELRFAPLFWLTIKNWFLMIVTLGLYWPFAKVAFARMHLEAVSVATRLNIDELHEQLRLADGDAAGDAAGDLFGVDIGL